MMEQSLYRFRAPLLDRRGDQRRNAAHSRSAAAIAFALPFAGPAPRRARTRPIAPLTEIRRIVAAMWRWRNRARSGRQLRELSDHLLKDIGLRREDVGYEFPKPFTHGD
jgi:uncharacterized protein YjiS (DUF1127 family)